MLPELFRVIGSDRCLTREEVVASTGPHPLIASAWDVYRTHFRCFTGSTLDPQFHRLTHPALRTGGVRVSSDETVVIVGTGPSLASAIHVLTRVRDHVRLFTSPRGAEALLRHGVVPDLVLIEHQTALDAHHSARHLADGGAPLLSRCPLVAADWRTPRAMLADIGPTALFVPGSYVPGSVPTWGLWPATAVAMAAGAGASRLALLGIDLGTATSPDPAHAPLRALLELLASLVTAGSFDCGEGGARKQGWRHATLDDIAGARVRGRLETHLQPAPSAEARVHDAEAALTALAPVIERAAQLRSIALQARTTGATAPQSLQDGMDEALGWGRDPSVRVPLQECLGLSFLPRFWRTGVDLSLGHALWRPLLLATHELTAQAGALAMAAAAERAA